MRRSRFPRRVLGALALAVCVGLSAAPATLAQDEAPRVYDETADARADIAAAVAKAAKDNKRVLLVYGGNWCHWCVKLDGLFEENREIARKILYEYEVVKIDVGQFDRNLDIVEKYGSKIRSGVPYLTILDGDGEVVTHQETGALEKGDRHDPAVVRTFLEKWQPEPQDAEELYADALARAKKENKRLLVHLGAPW